MSILSAVILAATPAASPVADAVEVVDRAAQERGNRSEVLVLGTSHLSSLPEDYDRGAFDPLLDRLARWQPEAIAIENLSGSQCDYLRVYAFAHQGTADTYCPDPTLAREILGLTGAQAEEAVERILSHAAQDRPAKERRRLVALFLAMGEPVSALVQWLRLPADERIADATLRAPLVAEIEARATKRGESEVIGASLAARLGLERVHYVDDHTGDRASGPGDSASYDAEMGRIWDNPAVAQLIPVSSAAQDRFLKTGDVLAWYRSLNDPKLLRLNMEADFGAAAAAELPANAGRRYLAYWETRNLRMVANLREVIGPGRRVLAIVGSSHKPYYERYLGMTSDVVLADLAPILQD